MCLSFSLASHRLVKTYKNTKAQDETALISYVFFFFFNLSSCSSINECTSLCLYFLCFDVFYLLGLLVWSTSDRERVSDLAEKGGDEKAGQGEGSS